MNGSVPVLPSLFLSHGAPDLLLQQNAAAQFLRNLAAELPRPRAILVVSAHWTADPIGITAAAELSTIHDFGGFEPLLYQQSYPARGDPALVDEVRQLLQQGGFAAEADPDRGLDHGAWVPLKLIYPQADIPVVQLSLPQASLADCARVGATLTPLRGQGVLIIGSGGSVHNLRRLSRSGATEPWAIEFEDWLQQAIEAGDFYALVRSTRFPESFRIAHPTVEHFAPLPLAWAAGGNERPGRRIHHSFTYGNLGMSCYRFD